MIPAVCYLSIAVFCPFKEKVIVKIDMLQEVKKKNGQKEKNTFSNTETFSDIKEAFKWISTELQVNLPSVPWKMSIRE
jgi:hypothetical protein